MNKDLKETLDYCKKRIDQINLMIKESTDESSDLFILGKRAAYQEVIIIIEGMGDSNG